jgi:hypothetical protein
MNQTAAARQPVVLDEWVDAPLYKTYRPFVRKLNKELEPYLETKHLRDESLYIPLDEINNLKAAVVRNDEETAERVRAKLQKWLDAWEPPGDKNDEDVTLSDDEMETVLNLLKKIRK